MITIPSLPKLILLIGIIVVVWYVFRFLGQVDRARQQAAREAAKAAAARGHRPTAGRESRGGVAQVEDMVKCRTCGAYVPVRSPSRCGRNDCPF
jgi:hypothetical protein